MQYQSRQFTCGPTALHNALNWLSGEGSPTLEECENACRRSDMSLDTEGTTEWDLKRAAKSFNYGTQGHSWRTLEKFRQYVQYPLSSPYIFHDRPKGHWIVVLGHLFGQGYVVIDSAHEDLFMRWEFDKLVNHVYERGHRIYALSVFKEHS